MGINFERNSAHSVNSRSSILNGQMGYFFSPSFYLESGITYHSLSLNQSFLQENQFFPSLTLQTLLREKILLSTTVKQQFLYSSFMSEGSLINKLKGTLWSGSVTVPLAEKFRFIDRWGFYWINDNNVRKTIDLSLLYGISQYPSWIWAGLGYSLWTHDETVSTYWSPEMISSITPQFEANLPLTEQWNFNFGLSLNYQQEKPNLSGWGYYSDSGFEYKTEQGYQFKINYQRIESRRTTTFWRGETFILSFHVDFHE